MKIDSINFLNDLIKMIDDIPCICHSAYKDRKLTDPHCPRCNWIDEDTVNRVKNNLKLNKELLK